MGPFWELGGVEPAIAKGLAPPLLILFFSNCKLIITQNGHNHILKLLNKILLKNELRLFSILIYIRKKKLYLAHKFFSDLNLESLN
jgi:hypothetical protein